ncbi:MAG: PAS domain S-box protein [Thermoguttaceae bacterium]
MSTTRPSCEELFDRLTQENAGDWLFWATPEGTFLHVSPACQGITGYSAAEFLADPGLLPRIVHLEDRPRVVARLATVETPAPGEELEFRIRRSDGAERWIGLHCQPILDNGRLSGLCGVNRDITARKQRELEFLRLNASLRRQRDDAMAVAEHRARQLRELNWELSQVEQRERRNLAQTLHDHLQQMLVAARLKLSLLGRHLHDELTQRLVQQLDGLLNDGITETRSLTTRLATPVLYELGLGASFQWLAKHMEQTFGLHVELTLDPTAEAAAEDARVLVFQAVREMLFNVVKHAQVDTACVELKRLEGERIGVVISDSGKGFVPAASSPSAFGSQGFGLANVSQRLELMGARVDIDSAPGRGTRITIDAPCR